MITYKILPVLTIGYVHFSEILQNSISKNRDFKIKNVKNF